MPRYAALLLVLVAAVAAAQPAPDRSRPPAIGPAPALALPGIEKRRLANGLPVWVVESHDVPVVQVDLVVAHGSGSDPAGRFGTASFTTAMLENGAGGRSALEIADAIDYLGAELVASSSTDAMGVRLHVPVARLKDALAIMADVALRPTFPAEEIDRERKDLLTSLVQARDDPAALASLAFSRVLYGAAHRLGTMQVGTPASIDRFTSEQLKSFYDANFRPENAALIVVGDVTPGEVLPLLEKSFGEWHGSGAAAGAAALPAVAEPAARKIYLVDKPGAAQSEIRIGWIGVARGTPDYFPVVVMNTLLGGSYQSRLNMNLREKHGYTYGASSNFDMRSVPGPFTAAAAVQTDKTAPALTEFFKELDAIRTDAPAKDVAQAKNYVSLRYPAAFETTREIARQLETQFVYRLPDDFFSSYVAKVRAVTPADVKRVAAKYIRPDRFAVVVVGDKSVIEPKIRALDLGPIETLKADDLFE